MGLLVESESLNAEIRNAIESDLDRANAWELQFDEDGRTVWLSDTEIRTSQPALSSMQRLEDWFFAHLPLEGEL
jgi:putative cardiolipin synthase